MLTFNPAAERMFEIDAEDIVGHPVTILMPATDAEAHQSYIDHYLETGEQRIIGKGRETMGVKQRSREEFAIFLQVTRTTIPG